jgi:uncharacterized Zn finger protein
MFIPPWSHAWCVADEAKTKIRESQGRHTLYLPQALVVDSAFPFEVGEDLSVRIDGKRLIVETMKKRTSQ